jgi:starch synthase
MLYEREDAIIDSSKQKIQLNTLQPESTVALLHCGDLIDDFLNTINISFDTFCHEFIGSWMFGYVNALKRVGVRTVLFCISARCSEVSRFTHTPTDTTICVLPASQSYLAYRAVRGKALKAYGGSDELSFTEIEELKSAKNSVLTTLKDLAKSVGTYMSTPLGLLAREIRREGCSAILCQEYEYARFDACMLLGKLIGVPVFATFQGGDKTQSFLEYPVRKLAFRGCKGLIIAPQTEMQRVRDRYQIANTKLARIFNPVDIASWRASERNEARVSLGIPLGARVVVCHGRIEIHRKGLDILLEAWSQICQERPQKDLRLLLIGTGSDADKLHQRIADMQLSRVMWKNKFVNDPTTIQRYLSAADVYTLASRQEGFPVAPIEAMACRLPIVAADAPGVPDILEGGEDSGGLIVPREDATALAQALGRILDDEAWGRELGKRARQRVEQYFSLEAVGKQLCEFLLN